jgi:hypothetical protein
MVPLHRPIAASAFRDKVFAAAEAVLVRSTPRPARRSGPRKSTTTRRATTCRWHRWSSTARCCSGLGRGGGRAQLPAAFDAETGKSWKTYQCRRRASPEAKPGRRAAIITARRRLDLGDWHYDPTPISPSGAPATAVLVRRPAARRQSLYELSGRLRRTSGAIRAISNIIPTTLGLGRGLAPIVVDYRRDGKTVGLARRRAQRLPLAARTRPQDQLHRRQPFVRQNVFKASTKGRATGYR